MDSEYINLSKVILAIKISPQKRDADLPFSEKHRWRVKIVMEDSSQTNCAVYKDFDTEVECDNLISQLGLFKL